jgi:hypothetical protein
MGSKRWDLQLGETLHLLHFQHGRYLRRNRRLLVDGQPVEANRWRSYQGKTPVVEYPFSFHGHTLTIVIRYVRGKPVYDLLLNGISAEKGRPLDLAGLAIPRTKMERFLEYALYVVLVILLRILMEILAR